MFELNPTNIIIISLLAIVVLLFVSIIIEVHKANKEANSQVVKTEMLIDELMAGESNVYKI